jgi:N-acetyltransferase
MKENNFKLPLVLENDRVILTALQEQDFDEVYLAASDPKVWEQHPNKDRWKQAVFRVYFDGALLSKSAFKIMDKSSDKTIGCTRFYDWNETDNSILIGYTFYVTACWGTGINPSVKTLMLNYAFQFADRVLFQIGAENLRSQIAIGRLGALKIDEQEIAYFGEVPKLNFIYEIKKSDWNSRKPTS